MNRIYNFLTVILISTMGFAQAPEKMSYQAIVRNAVGELVSEQTISMRISILQTSATGTVVYQETHTPNTNVNGLVSIEIGDGSSSNDFSAIDWSAGPYYIKTETDPEAGSNYTITGVSQLMSVPFALHAKVAQSVASPTYSIGYWPELGGYVFMISTDGKHGLVCELVDQSVTPTSWYNAQNLISNPSNHSEAGQGFVDWRLPTRYELAQMYSYKNAIQAAGETVGYPNSFGSKTYWSSTQSAANTGGGGFDFPEETAWRQNFFSGGQFNSTTYTLSSSDFFVRSVRAF